MASLADQLASRAATLMVERHVTATEAAAIACNEMNGSEHFHDVVSTMAAHRATRQRALSAQQSVNLVWLPHPRFSRTVEQIAAARVPYLD
jgi:hypothetical protein